MDLLNAGAQPGRSRGERAFEKLQKQGLRATSGRICVLQVLQDNRGGPMSADRVFQQLSDIGIRLSLGTVYRILGELQHVGIVRKEWGSVETAGKQRYQLAPESETPTAYVYACPICQRELVINDKAFCELMQQYAIAGGFDRTIAAAPIQVCCNVCADKLKKQD